jgi:hypothetical protein
MLDVSYVSTITRNLSIFIYRNISIILQLDTHAYFPPAYDEYTYAVKEMEVHV